MTSVAFLYPGQGSQRVGMGEGLLASDPEIYNRYLELAEDVSGLPLRRLSIEGPLDELTRTEVAQPALFALSLALTEVAREIGLEPDYVAGHSLGEYTAAVAAGVLSVDDGMRLVAERGRLMANVQAEWAGSMAAVKRLAHHELEALCQTAATTGSIAIANLNAPNQIVVSGAEQAVGRLCELVREAGGRTKLLPVGAAFHSDLMKPVQESLAAATSKLDWRDARVPLAANCCGRMLIAADDIRAALVTQTVSTVRWVDCVNALVGAGVDLAVELGAGDVLRGLVARIDPNLQVVAAESRDAIQGVTRHRAAIAGPARSMEEHFPRGA
jgi:[acyl-carrier-protein] S-malonyltransferase